MPSQFAELDLKLNEDDLEILKDNDYIDCCCEISIRIKLNKKVRKKIK